MKKPHRFKSEIAIVLLTCATAFTPVLSYGQLPRQTESRYESLIPEIREIMRQTNAVGLAIAIIEDYEVVWTRGFGLRESGTTDSVTVETLFQAASITKPLTATAVMKKVETHKISLSGNVNEQLTSWSIPDNSFTLQSPVTVKQLLSHTSGVAGIAFPPYLATEKLPSLGQVLEGTAPAKNRPIAVTDFPGKRFAYTGGGYVILELLLTEVDQTSYASIVEREIFEPLDMSSSTFNHHLPNASFPLIASGHDKRNAVLNNRYSIVHPLSFGSLWSTPEDLAKFLSEIQRSLGGRSERILTQSGTALMLEPVTYSSHTAGGKYALGFSLEPRGPVQFFGHDGHNYGYVCSMLGSLEGGYGMVIMTNSENGWKAINKVKKLVGRKYWGLGPYHPKSDR